MNNRADIIQEARKESASRFAGQQNHYSLKQKLALTCRILFAEGHTANDTLAGQITARCEDSQGHLAMWTQPFGATLAEIEAKDYLKINRKLQTIEGDGIPNKANNFHLFVYEKRPDVQAIIHTHPRYASILSLLGQALKIVHMDTMGLYDDIAFLPEWPGVPFGDEEGVIITNGLGDKNSILLAHHGLLTVGRTVEEACYRAYYFEKAAEQQVRAISTGLKIKDVNRDFAIQARDWKLSDGPLLARFYSWVRKILKESESCLNETESTSTLS